MNWIQEVSEFCQYYNISLEYLAEILRDPKVIPMVRGKAFEFFVAKSLKEVLPSQDWEVEKPFLNPQLGSHDSDVKVIHISTGKIISVECKLADKGSYKYIEKLKLNAFRVKCMRSRTLGEAKVKQLAPIYGVSEAVLKIHNDQYLPTDFSIVITSIANAFYDTDKSSGSFIWKPSTRGEIFLRNLQYLYGVSNDLKDFGFSRMYVARACDIVIKDINEIICTRKKCDNKQNCGFIPNYPVIGIPNECKYPVKYWTPVEESIKVFESLL
ncbi:MAG: restriction endonuclease [Coleofasciculaceae cyanobacterium SM2_1_6]|nr:restriction endonuclease [Coleofasciculaceae cyanobacterium SM2_1_6]